LHIFIITLVVIIILIDTSKLPIDTRKIQVSNKIAPTLRIVVCLDRK